MRQSSSWRRIGGLWLAVLLGACTNGGKNQRDTTGMTPGSAGGQLGGAPAVGATTSPVPGAAADSTTSRRDTLGGRMAHPMQRAPMMPPAVRDSMHRMMRDTARRRP